MMFTAKRNTLLLLTFLLALSAFVNSFLSNTPPAFGAFVNQQVTAVAATAPTFNYQGTLRSPDGSLAKDGEYNITFRIYDALISGNRLHEEAISNVAVRDGQFSVVLGDTKSFSSTIFAASPRYLGIAVNGEPEMIPRQQIRPVPWALQADVAHSVMLDGQIVTAAQTDTVRFGDITNDDASKNLSLAAGGYDRVWVTKGGDVGIGTNAPSKGADQLKLDVDGSVGASKYCDQNGNNCRTITEIAAPAFKVYQAPAGCGGNLTTATSCLTLVCSLYDSEGGSYESYLSCDGNCKQNNPQTQGSCSTTYMGQLIK